MYKGDIAWEEEEVADQRKQLILLLIYQSMYNHILKDYYKDEYYSVGFDFGIGKITGLVFDRKKGNYWKTYDIKKPFNKTLAKTLMNSKKNIYFIDLQRAVESDSSNFFSKKNKHLLIAAGGYQPKPLHKIMISKIYTETYDGLIFVKEISIPDYKLEK